MSFFSDLGKTLGGIAGTAFGGPIGSIAGSALGGVAGNALEGLFGGGKRPSLEGLLGGSGLPLPFGAGQIVNLVERNLGKVVDALGDNMAGGIRGAGSIRDALLGNVAGGLENVGQIRDAIFDRMEGAIRNFGPGALPWLGRPTQPWPFPNLPIPRLPFCPVGPGAVQTPHGHGPDYKGLETNGKDSVDTGRYVVTCKEGEVKVYDKETNTWVNCHGDPHLSTSDGDKGQFHENLTLQLEDGTKITIKTTPQDANGVAWIDSVAVMKGDQAVVIDGFHDGKAGVQMGNILNNRGFVDASMRDGTVMVAGHQVDDLSFAANGRELVGGDPKARWGEWNLDGFGGAPKRPPVQGGNGGNGGAGNTGGTGGTGNTGGTGGTGNTGGAGSVGNDFGFEPGDSLIDKLFKILSKLEEKLNGAVEKLGTIKEGDQSGLQKAMFEIQKLQNMMKQVFETITNIQKSNDDSKEAIIRNFA